MLHFYNSPFLLLRIIYLLLVLTLRQNVYCQVEDLRFDNILTSNGLVHDIVTSIDQDKDGFIWIGTEDGLTKYDSYTFTIFKNDIEIESSLIDDWITRVFCDKKGRIWIGTAKGLDRYDKKSNGFIHYKFPQSKNSMDQENKWIVLLYEDQKGNIFSYTHASGLVIYNEDVNQFEKNDLTHKLESAFEGYLTSLISDNNGTYWIATTNQLLKWENENSFSYFRTDKENETGLSDSLIFDMCDDNDFLWIATESGLNKLNKKTGIIKKYFSSPGTINSLCDSKVLDLFKDSKGNIWVGTYYGLNKYNPAKDNFFCYKHNSLNPFSISADRIYSITEDKAGIIWLGTYKGGVSKIDYRMNRFLYYGYNPLRPGSLSGEIVRTIYKASDGTLWIGTDGEGLNKYDSKRKFFTHYKHSKGNPSSISSNSILWITEDKKGNIWTAASGGGLCKYIPAIDGFKNYKAGENGLKSDMLNVIYIDRENVFWVGTDNNGLFTFNPITEKFAPYLIDSSQPDINIHAIFQDSHGYVWIGSFGGGLFRIDKKKHIIKKFLNNPEDLYSLSSNVIYSISEDRRKNIWISTFRGGLNLFNKEKEKFIPFKEKEGLPSNYVKAALADENNNLWLLTNKGLARFNTITNEIKIFNEKDGLRSGDFLSGAYFIDSDGTIYAGGSKGFISFHPMSFKESSYLPPVVITNFKVMDETYNTDVPLTELKEVILSFDQNFISFEFAALEYSAVDKNQYAYRLTGLNRDWVYSGKRRYASYTHLDPGEYVFKVKAANNDGIWGDEAVNIKIVITPPFWITWWFRILTLLVVVLITYALYRYRIRRLLEIERIKNRLASDLHDDIATNLSSIAMFSQIINDESKKSRTISPMMNELMEKITSMSQDSVSSIRDIIWAIDPKQETIFDLLIRARDSFIIHCRAKGIDFNLDVPDKEHLPKENLAPEERKNLWLLIKEAVTNSIKHSCATEISLHAFYRSRNMNIIILDNGKGFNTTADYTGKGMSSMKKRAENLGGEFTIVSNSESGTIINISFKM